jgi:hypothetical protein
VVVVVDSVDIVLAAPVVAGQAMVLTEPQIPEVVVVVIAVIATAATVEKVSLY